MPENKVSTDFLGSLVERRHPDKGATWAIEKLGIRERRFMAPLEPQTGHPTDTGDELDMAEAAARRALDAAGATVGTIGGLWLVTCTQSNGRQHFSDMALALHRRLGLEPEALALQMDAGCGGALHAVACAQQLMTGGAIDSMLVVASNAPSKFFDHWEAYAENGAWLSMYIFGDGAGAVLLRRTANEHGPGILATYAAVDPHQPLMGYRTPPGCSKPLYEIDGRAVAASFSVYARRALDGLTEKYPFDLEQIRRFYFHQVNARVLEAFVDKAGIAKDRVAVHVDRYGNLAAAATLVLLDEDIRAERVGPGDLCVFCTVGAGAQYGAMLVRL